MTYVEACKLAEQTYSGVYLVENAGDGYFKVFIHSPSGPIKWVTPDGRIGSRAELRP